MTVKRDSDLLIMNNKELQNTMTMYQTKKKIEGTKHHKNISPHEHQTNSLWNYVFTHNWCELSNNRGMVRNIRFRCPITSMKGTKSNSAEIKLLNFNISCWMFT